MRSAPSTLQRCFLRSWGSCLLPCSAACAKPRASGHMPHPPFSPVQRSERRSISSCCRRASHRGALPATCLHTAERFAFVLRRPSPLPRHLLEATALGLPAAPPVLPSAFLPARLYIVLLPARVASQSVAFNALAHGRALRVRGYLLKPPFSPVQRYRHSSLRLLSTCVASRSVSFNWLAHGRALRVRIATATR